MSSVLPSVIMTGNDGKEEVTSAGLHVPSKKDRVDPTGKEFSGKSFFQQYRDLCKNGLYLYACADDEPVKFVRFPKEKSDVWLEKHGWERDSDGLWRLHITVKHLRWLADGAGAVKQSSHVGHSHQRDLSVWCSISRQLRQMLRSSGMKRLRYGCYVGISANVQNKLFKLCKTKQDKDILASLTGIRGLHPWHCEEVNGDGGWWSDGLWHAFATGAKKLLALLMTLMRVKGLHDIWMRHCHTCFGKHGGNWCYITLNTNMIQICGCNGGKVRDLCCLSAEELFTCSCSACMAAVKKAGGRVEDGKAYFLSSEQMKHVGHVLSMFREMWKTCSTVDYDEFLRRRVFLRVQAASFNDHVATIFGPECITPKFASLEYLLPLIAYSLPDGIPLGYLNEQPIEAHHIIRDKDVGGASGPNPVTWRLKRELRVAIKSHRWLWEREPVGAQVTARKILSTAAKIKVETAAIKSGLHQVDAVLNNEEDFVEDYVLNTEGSDDVDITWGRSADDVALKQLHLTLFAKSFVSLSSHVSFGLVPWWYEFMGIPYVMGGGWGLYIQMSM